MAVIKAVSSKAGINTVLDYVMQEEKTEQKLLSGLNCVPDTVKDEMRVTEIIVGLRTEGDLQAFCQMLCTRREDRSGAGAPDRVSASSLTAGVAGL